MPTIRVINNHLIYREAKDDVWQFVVNVDPSTGLLPGDLVIPSQRAFHHPHGGGMTVLELDGETHVAITLHDVIAVLRPDRPSEQEENADDHTDEGTD